MKRFTDSAIWDKLWFMRLSAPEKAAFMYILSKCDCIGIWDINDLLLSACTGYKKDIRELAKKVNNNIEMFGKDKIWLPKFCAFQYGELRDTCCPHRKYISELKKRNLFERVVKGYRKGTLTLQEEEEEEEEEKEREKEEEEARLKAEEEAKEEAGKKAALLEKKQERKFEAGPMEDAWRSWKRHRIQIKKEITLEQEDKVIKKLTRWGESRSVAAITYSIEQGWQGLFEEDAKKRTTTHKELPKGKAELSRGWLD